MFSKIRKLALLLAVVFFGLSLCSICAYAKTPVVRLTGNPRTYSERETDDYYINGNNETDYVCTVMDDAHIFDFDDQYFKKLKKEINSFTEYGSICVATIDNAYGGSTRDAALNFFGEDGDYENINMALLLIDMDNRMIYIHSMGRVNSILTASRAETITDNVYKYASNGDYERCAYEAVLQMNTIMGGGRIAQPMRYICNALLAMLFGIFIMYYIAKKSSSSQDIVAVEELLKDTNYYNKLNDVDIRFVTSRKTRRSSSSSGGGGGHSGGGHSSGSGGGHHF